ncbi:FecCD family ABC transporter permease [Paenibacillus sp. NPDC056579]|uniref:FecCD family ABC transporter permease n=1 Tax=Paenibacillus sp. NPDC056579 TaxID=3345871 RepID=UPI0036B538B5
MPRNSMLRFWTVAATGLLLFLAVVYISITNGAFDIPVKDVFGTLLRIHPNPDYDLVLFDFRLPRIVIAALVGLGLGIAGAVIQGITRNGLADPGILGINAGAGSVVVLFMLLYQGKMSGIGWASAMAMPLFGWVGGVGAAVLIFLFAWSNGRLDSQRLILSGIAIASGLGAFTMYISLKMNPQDFEMATVWLSGSVWNANWRFVAAALPWLVVLVPFIWWKSRLLDLFQLQQDSAVSVGVAVDKETVLLLLASVGIVAACVSVSGSMGFVGLMAPHIAKRLVGIQHKKVIPVCGLVGMVLVVAADFIGKTIFAPVTLPAGIVIAILGVPYFIYLLFRAKSQ